MTAFLGSPDSHGRSCVLQWLYIQELKLDETLAAGPRRLQTTLCKWENNVPAATVRDTVVVALSIFWDSLAYSLVRSPAARYNRQTKSHTGRTCRQGRLQAGRNGGQAKMAGRRENVGEYLLCR